MTTQHITHEKTPVKSRNKFQQIFNCRMSIVPETIQVKIHCLNLFVPQWETIDLKWKIFIATISNWYRFSLFKKNKQFINSFIESMCNCTYRLVLASSSISLSTCRRFSVFNFVFQTFFFDSATMTKFTELKTVVILTFRSFSKIWFYYYFKLLGNGHFLLIIIVYLVFLWSYHHYCRYDKKAYKRLA